MGIVSAIPEKCKRCYACVRECPAKAIKVARGQAVVVEDRCIACGNCVKVCTQNAKRIQDDTDAVRRMLAETKPKFACLAPSFPAAFDKTAPGKVITAIRKLGFDEVWNVAFGAELVAREYARLVRESDQDPVIATPCPALVAYIEKYVPALRNALAPIVSPMIATARAIRYQLGKDCCIVFIGPCIAKKNEIRDPFVVGRVNSVLTYKELVSMFEHAGIVLDDLEETDFDGPRSYMGGVFPLTGGLLKTAGRSADVLDNDIVIAEGKDRALVALKELAEGASHARFLDVLFCEGCIHGPKMLNDLGLHARKELLANYINALHARIGPDECEADLARFQEVHLARMFTVQDLSLPQPSDDEVAQALESMHKFLPTDRLDCGACGYPTCLDKAIAVCQGLAEASMCLPYLIDELETTIGQLQSSACELESAQQRLVQTERLASMGQLSAGVAHEINNPLGTVLIYSHMLLRKMQQEDPSRTDLEMIVNEATRCKNIVRGLLDFARQSRVSKAPTDLRRIIDEVMVIMAPRAKEHGISLSVGVQDNLPIAMNDGDQIKQMLVNLLGNGIDAVKGDHGEVGIRARHEDHSVTLDVFDTGKGIAEEHRSKLFTPFFTTKELGKGTGLGLAICYGIVKMHSGDISVESEEGHGSTFTITLPVGSPQSGG